MLTRHERLVETIAKLQVVADRTAKQEDHADYSDLREWAQDLLAIWIDVDDIYALTFWTVRDNDTWDTDHELSKEAFLDLLEDDATVIQDAMVSRGGDVLRDLCYERVMELKEEAETTNTDNPERE